MNLVLAWVRTNVATVVFIAVMIGALVSLPIVSSRLNQGIRDDMKKRQDELSKLAKLEKTEISLAVGAHGQTVSATALVNQKLLDRLNEVAEVANADADRVREAALEHNQKGRGVLMPELFPAPVAAEAEVIPWHFFQRLTQAYKELLAGINAGSPPAPEAMHEDLDEARAKFILQILQKDVEEQLDEEEQAQLREALTNRRMSLYAEEADSIGIYATTNELNVPGWDQAHVHTMEELFDWQWQYWIVQDILGAIGEANRSEDGSRYAVQQAPVKRIVDLLVWAHDSVAGSETGAGEPRAGRPGGAPPTPGEPDPNFEVKLNYAASFTGRMTNPLYDVRLVTLTLIVDTARLPVVLDALARQNFITVLDLEMVPVDPFAAVGSGYFYGSAHASQVTLELETVWFRKWTTPYMPDKFKQLIGIAPPASSG